MCEREKWMKKHTPKKTPSRPLHYIKRSAFRPAPPPARRWQLRVAAGSLVLSLLLASCPSGSLFSLSVAAPALVTHAVTPSNRSPSPCFFHLARPGLAGVILAFEDVAPVSAALFGRAFENGREGFLAVSS